MQKLRFDNIYDRPLCIALGFFDSVHCGHREILGRTVNSAAALGADSAVFTFDNNMNSLFSGDEKQVYTFEERLALFDKLKMNLVVFAHFDSGFMSLKADRFLDRLFSSLKIKKAICGYDYRFGYKGSGDADLLKRYCNEHGAECEIVSEIKSGGERVSTTLIKKLLYGGNITEANRLLVDPFSTVGTVVHGRSVGHLYDMPTANIIPEKDKLLPREGVYATYAIVDGKKYKSVTNVGGKPTFGLNDVSVETMLIDFNGTLYGKELKIEFVKKLRDIKKFETPTKLSEQIRKDIDWRH